MLKSMYVDIQEALIDSPKAPLEQSYLSYISGSTPDHCQEKAGNPTYAKLPIYQFPTGNVVFGLGFWRSPALLSLMSLGTEER